MQTFGDLVTLKPHIHALVADGVFLPSGRFRVLPPLPETALCEALRHKVLDFLSAKGVFSVDLAERMKTWRHSGFSAIAPASMQSSVDNRIRTNADDAEGRQRLARYMIRCPFALEKVRYDAKSAMVIYRSKLHATLKRNYELMPALQWLRLLMNHVPDKYEHLVRYYGYYSNRSRGVRRLTEQAHDAPASTVIDEPTVDARRKANWARLIQKVVALGHPWPSRHWHFRVRRTRSIRLSAPRGTAMRIIVLIEDGDVIERILKHLNVWGPQSKTISLAGPDPPWPQGETIPLTYHPVPDIA